MTSQTRRRLLPVAILLLGLAAFLLFDLERFFSMEVLHRNQAALAAWVAAHEILAMPAYVLAYGLLIAFSLPVAVIVTPLGGALFGLWLGTALSVLGATAGSVVVFLAARSAFGDLLRARAGSRLRRLEDGFRRDGFNYLLFLRLVPVFPFWLINIGAAVLGLPLGAYTLATFLGIIPGAFVYSSVGAGLGSMIERGQVPDAGMLLEWRILMPLLGLAALALAPVVYGRLRGKHAGS
ncbi:MAG: TVP38/TMEM64 family protein [Reyranellaceae bacterium]